MKRGLLVTLVFLLSCVPIFTNGYNDSVELELICLTIALICSAMLFSYPKEPYSTHKIIHIFFLFFMSIAPIVQFKSGVQMMGSFFTIDEYIDTSYLVLFALIIYNVLYYLFRHLITPRKIAVSNLRPIGGNREALLVAVSSVIVLYFLYVNKFNLVSLFVRGGELVTRQSQGQMQGLLMENFLRPMPVILFLSAYFVKVRHKVVLYILFILMLVAAPPSGMARYSVAALYIPVCLCVFPRLRRGYSFVFLLVFGLLVIFPMLNIFRYVQEGSALKFEISFDQFTDMNFDSFSMFMRVVSEDVVTYGRQLLGVLLFFVPRSMWSDKPIGSGAYVADLENLHFSNLSMPFIGEGYINFGIWGVLLFIIVLSSITAYLDKQYWTVIYNTRSTRHIQYMLILGLILFVMRGDLMSSFAYTCGFITSYYFAVNFMVGKSR